MLLLEQIEIIVMDGVPYNINMDESTRVNLRKMTQHMLYNKKEMLRLL